MLFAQGPQFADHIRLLEVVIHVRYFAKELQQVEVGFDKILVGRSLGYNCIEEISFYIAESMDFMIKL